MDSKPVDKIDYDEFVEMFNSKGKSYTDKFVQEKYGRCYTIIQKRVAKESKYRFNKNTRKYEEKPPTAVDTEFISIDELYKGKDTEKSDIEPLLGFYTPPTMDEIMLEMIKDRVLELSRYITIDHSNNKIVVKSKHIRSSGYELILI